MKVLQLCHKPPFPCKDGGCIAMHTITQGLLNKDVDVKLLTLFTQKHDLELEKLSSEYKEKTDIEGVFVDTRVNWVDAFSNLLTSDSYNVSRFFTPDFDRRLTKLLRRYKYDIVHVESLFMTPYIPTIRRFSKSKIVLRSHNLEYMIWEHVAAGTKSGPKRAYLKYLSKQLKEYELHQLSQVDGVACISKEDYQRYASLSPDRPLVNIPFGINPAEYDAKPLPEKLSLFHIGAMDWTPNIEGIVWFLDEIWPSIHKAFPDLEFFLAGRNMPKSIINASYPNVKVIGEVEDASEFMSEHTAMVVPLLSAGGIRVKIIEGMALGRSALSTSIGAKGIDYQDGKNIFIADTADQFINAIKLLSDQVKAVEMSQNAQELIESKYNNAKLINELISFYQTLLEE